MLLYENEPDYTDIRLSPVLTDLRIAPVMEAVMEFGGDRAYLRDYFAQKPRHARDVRYRLDIVRDLENPALFDGMDLFIQRYGLYKRYLDFEGAAVLPDVKAKYRLDAACAYCEGLTRLARDMEEAGFASMAFTRFYEELTAYLRSENFLRLKRDADSCMDKINACRYLLTLYPLSQKITLEADDGTGDYFADFTATFARYGGGAFNVPTDAFPDPGMCLLETMLLERIKRAHPDIFTAVRAFYERYEAWEYPLIAAFERELHFYRVFMVYRAHMEGKGYHFVRPVLTDGAEIIMKAGYDLSLAQANKPEALITNDFYKGAEERHFILTGPNQGGKTTFARTLGQCLYFAHLGLPAPCRSFACGFFDGIYTHFIQPEVAGSNLGRLKEELSRLKNLLDTKPSNGFIIVNELFSSATSLDARDMGNLLLARLERAGCVCLYVTHIFELASDGAGRVSLTACMDEKGKRRTYKIERRAADGLAFASHLMDKHHLYRGEIEVRMNERLSAISG